MKLRAAFVVVLLLPCGVRAQGAPDFSGTWAMDASRSESAVQNEPIGPVTLVISQTANELKMETTRGQRTTTAILKLDGSENRIASGTAKTHWDGATLGLKPFATSRARPSPPRNPGGSTRPAPRCWSRRSSSFSTGTR
jgi:hypothetical protein